MFVEKKEAALKKTKKGKDEDVDMEESKVDDSKQKQKIFSQALNSEEYKTLIKFFAQELPTLALELGNVKEFPTVEKLAK